MERHLLLLGRNFAQWRRPTQQGESGGSALWGGVGGGLSPQPPSSPHLPVAAKAVQRFESGGDGSPGRGAPRQRLLLLEVIDKKVSVWSRAGVGRSSVTSLILTPSLATAADLQLGSRPGCGIRSSSDPPCAVAERTSPSHLLSAQPEARALPSLWPVGFSCARWKGTYCLAPTASSGL